MTVEAYIADLANNFISGACTVGFYVIAVWLIIDVYKWWMADDNDRQRIIKSMAMRCAGLGVMFMIPAILNFFQ